MSKEGEHGQTGKLAASSAQVQVGDGELEDPSDVEVVMEKVIGKCPVVEVGMGGCFVKCLLDTGAEVSTITEKFFRNHLLPRGHMMKDITGCITITAANGLPVPYLGYLECELVIMGKVFKDMGFLVTRDLVDPVMRQRRVERPGIIGCNILQRVGRTLSSELGPGYLESIKVNDSGPKWASVLSLFTDHSNDLKQRHVRLAGKKPHLLPAGSAVTVLAHVVKPVGLWQLLVEPLDHGSSGLPNGVHTACSVVRADQTCIQSGVVPVQVWNLNQEDIWLQPKSVLGSIHVVEIVESTNNTTDVDVNEVTVEHATEGCSVDDSPNLDLGGLDLSDEDLQRVKTLLIKHKDVFSRDSDDIGYCNAVPHQILTMDDRPVRVPHRRVHPNQWEEVKAYLKKWLKLGVLQESTSCYASPAVLVRKKDNSLRLCIDYRQLNLKTINDAFPLPRVDECLEAITGSKYFSTLDLAHGYYQCAIDARDVPKTAFRVGTSGLYEFTRMPMGLCNAPATFSRLMNHVLGNENFNSLLIYLDDVLVFGKSVDEMLQRLDTVFGKLRAFGLKIKPQKCSLFRREVKFLGHIVSAAGVATDPEKIKAVQEWEEPTSETELRSFLGLAGYYRRYVPSFAQIAKPLHQCIGKATNTKKGAKKRLSQESPLFHEKWNQDCTLAFQKLKEKLTSAPVLAHPDFSKPFVVETDASFRGLGAVLSQEDGVIAYASRGLRPAERNDANYSSMKLELLALKWAVTEKFRPYLIGSHFTVYTDNNPLSYIQTSKLGATELRWVAQLAQFDYEIKYRSGRSNVNADALSRKTWHGEPVSAEVNTTHVKVEMTELDRHDRKGNDAPLKPGDRVFLRNRGVLGRNKIQDRWVAIPYRVEERMSPESPLYRVQRVDGLGQPRIVHHSAILDVKDIRAPADNMVTAPEESQCTHDNVMDNHVQSTSEGSSTPVNRWMILRDVNRPQMPTVRAETVPSTPVIQDGVLEEERPESSESLKHVMDNHTLEEEQSPTLVRDDARGSPSIDSRPVRAPARSSPSVDSDGDSTSESDQQQSRRHRRVKTRSQYERSGRSTADDEKPLRRSKRATAGRNPNPHNLPRSAALRMTELTVPPSFEELSKAMLNLGSMVQSAWLQAQVSTSHHK